MKRSALAIVLLAVMAGAIILLARPGVEASPDATISVNSTGDTDSRDGVLTLREAMLLATGWLGVDSLDSGECDQVSNSTYGPPCSTSDTIGAASADTVVFDGAVFPPGSPATVALSSGLPPLGTGNDTLEGSGGVIVDGMTSVTTCLYISSDGNFVRGLEIYNCWEGVGVSGRSNTIGGPNPWDRNVISGHEHYGMLLIGSDNRVIGNYIGTDAEGNAPLANRWTGVYLGGQNNTIGGATESERNVISGNTEFNVFAFGSGNRVVGNYIGTNASGDAPLALADQETGVIIWPGAENITIGGTSQGERNVISGNGFFGVALWGDGDSHGVIGNYIGTNAAGDAGLGNQSYGVDVNVGYNYTIGGSSAGERNVISGNQGAGFRFENDGTSGNRVVGNYIGTNAAGDGAVPNGEGITIWQGAENNTIGGSSVGERNVISGNNNDGVEIWSNGNSIIGNYIGTNAAGDAPLPNWTGVAVLDADNNIIGGPNEGERNVISGNDYGGVLLVGTGNKVIGNYIGTNAAGDAPMPNQQKGVDIGAAQNLVGGLSEGERNVIAYNAQEGVLVRSSATGNTIRGNSIHSNGLKGIATIDGGNLELAPPIIDSVGGSVSGHTDPKCYPCTVEIFSDDEDEGRSYHGFTTTNDDATGTWTYSGTVTGPNVTATVTDAGGNTSEFSAPVAYSPPPVGGLAELPDVAGSSGHDYIAIAGLAAAALAAFTAGAWYARRRRLG